jgi:hypothetical protein
MAMQALLIAFLLLYPFDVSAQITRLRVGTNAPASTESVLFSIAKDAGILRQNQTDVEIIYIDGKPTVKGLQVALDDIVKDNPRAKGLSVRQFVDLSFLP